MWIVIAILGISAAVSFGESYRRSRTRGKTLKDILEEAGLLILKRSPWLTARSGSFEMQIQESGPKDWIQLELPNRGFYAAWIKTVQDENLTKMEVGDEAFDSRFAISGSSRVLYAWLDAETRRLLLDLSSMSGSLSIGDGSLQATMDIRQLPGGLPLLRVLNERLLVRMDIAQRLAENARQDPEAGVRLRNLRVLAVEFPGEPGTLEAHRAACSDASPQVRLQAARELGAEGHAILLELAESTDDATSAEAITRLGRELPAERTRAILVQALRRRHLQTVRACLEALGGSTAAEDVDTLAKVMVLEKGELAAAAAKALGTTGSPAAEPPLILALQRAELADLQVAAANALARIGSPEAVLPLKDLAERAHHPEVRKAARLAIAEIQSRLQGASPGQLSLAGAEAGQLSLAQAEAGQLSLASDPAGQLSLPTAEPGQVSLSGGEEG